MDKAKPRTNFFAQFSAWLESPTEVASACPSTRVLTSAIAERIDFSSAKVVVDLGPATGETCRELLAGMNSNSKLLAIEQSGGLANKLKEIKDDRFRGIHGDAADLMIHLSENGLSRPQAIVSGIPFSTIEAEKCRRIIHAIEQALEPKGFFIAYQIRSTVVDYAAPYFGEPETSWVWWNFPPLRIFVWQKM